MSCSHDGYHEVRSYYDRGSATLMRVWTCERCGARLREASRVAYLPAYEPLSPGRPAPPAAAKRPSGDDA